MSARVPPSLKDRERGFMSRQLQLGSAGAVGRAYPVLPGEELPYPKNAPKQVARVIQGQGLGWGQAEAAAGGLVLKGSPERVAARLEWERMEGAGGQAANLTKEGLNVVPKQLQMRGMDWATLPSEEQLQERERGRSLSPSARFPLLPAGGAAGAAGGQVVAAPHGGGGLGPAAIKVTEVGVQVYVRSRPYIKNELSHNAQVPPALKMYPTRVGGVVTACNPSARSAEALAESYRSYCVDRAFWSSSERSNDGAPYVGQQDIARAFDDAVEMVVSGFNFTAIAYGAKQTGKTYTMWGPDATKTARLRAGGTNLGNSVDEGLIPRLGRQLMDRVNECNDAGGDPSRRMRRLELEVAMIDVLNNDAYDLLRQGAERPVLSSVQLTAKDTPFGEQRYATVPGLQWKRVSSHTALMANLVEGLRRRTYRTADTSADASSKSHCLVFFQLTTHAAGDGALGKLRPHAAFLSRSTLTLVDLAGGEAGKNLTREAMAINKSLSVFRCVMERLSRPDTRIPPPYRDHTLTKLLINSLGGNCKTVILATVSPHVSAYRDNKHTLHFVEVSKDVCSLVTYATPNPNPEARIEELVAVLDDPNISAEERLRAKDQLHEEYKELDRYENRVRSLQSLERDQVARRSSQQLLVDRFNSLIDSTNQKEQSIGQALSEVQQVSKMMAEKLAQLENKSRHSVADREEIQREKSKTQTHLDEVQQQQHALTNLRRRLIKDLDDHDFDSVADGVDVHDVRDTPGGAGEVLIIDDDAAASPRVPGDPSIGQPLGITVSPPRPPRPQPVETAVMTEEKGRLASPVHHSPQVFRDSRVAPQATLRVQATVGPSRAVTGTLDSSGVGRLHYCVTQGRSEHAVGSAGQLVHVMQHPPQGSVMGVGSLVVQGGTEQAVVLSTCKELQPGPHCVAYLTETLEGCLQDEVGVVGFRVDEAEAADADAAPVTIHTLPSVLDAVSELKDKAVAGVPLSLEDVKEIRDAACQVGRLGKGAGEVAAQTIIDRCRALAQTDNPSLPAPSTLMRLAQDAEDAAVRHPEIAAQLRRAAGLLRGAAAKEVSPSVPPTMAEVWEALGEALGGVALLEQSRRVTLQVWDVARRVHIGERGGGAAGDAGRAGGALRAMRNRAEAPKSRQLLQTAAACMDRVVALFEAGGAEDGREGETRHAHRCTERAAGCGGAAVAEYSKRLAAACTALTTGTSPSWEHMRDAARCLADEARAAAVHSAPAQCAVSGALHEAAARLDGAKDAVMSEDYGGAEIELGKAAAAARCGADVQAAAEMAGDFISQAMSAMPAGGENGGVAGVEPASARGAGITSLLLRAHEAMANVSVSYGGLAERVEALTSRLMQLTVHAGPAVSQAELSTCVHRLRVLAGQQLSPDEHGARVAAGLLSVFEQNMATQADMPAAHMTPVLQQVLRDTRKASFADLAGHPTRAEEEALAIARDVGMVHAQLAGALRHGGERDAIPPTFWADTERRLSKVGTESGAAGTALNEVLRMWRGLKDDLSAPSPRTAKLLDAVRRACGAAAHVGAEGRRVVGELCGALHTWSVETATGFVPAADGYSQLFEGLADGAGAAGKLVADALGVGADHVAVKAVTELSGALCAAARGSARGDAQHAIDKMLPRITEQAAAAAGLPFQTTRAAAEALARLAEDMAVRVDSAAGGSSEGLSQADVNTLWSGIREAAERYPEFDAGFRAAAARFAGLPDDASDERILTAGKGAHVPPAEDVRAGDLHDVAAVLRRAADPIVAVEAFSKEVEHVLGTGERVTSGHGSGFGDRPTLTALVETSDDLALRFPRLRGALHATSRWLASQREVPASTVACPQLLAAAEELLQILRDLHPGVRRDAVEAAIALAKAGGPAAQVSEILRGFARDTDGVPAEVQDVVYHILCAQGAGGHALERLIGALEHVHRRGVGSASSETWTRLREEACILGSLGAGIPETAARSLAKRCHTLATGGVPAPDTVQLLVADLAELKDRHPEVSGAAGRALGLLRACHSAGASITAAATGAAAELSRVISCLEDARYAAVDVAEAARVVSTAAPHPVEANRALNKAIVAVKTAAERVEAPPLRDCLLSSVECLQTALDLTANAEVEAAVGHVNRAAAAAEAASGCGPAAAVEGVKRLATTCVSTPADGKALSLAKIDGWAAECNAVAHMVPPTSVLRARMLKCRAELERAASEFRNRNPAAAAAATKKAGEAAFATVKAHTALEQALANLNTLALEMGQGQQGPNGGRTAHAVAKDLRLLAEEIRALAPDSDAVVQLEAVVAGLGDADGSGLAAAVPDCVAVLETLAGALGAPGATEHAARCIAGYLHGMASDADDDELLGFSSPKRALLARGGEDEDASDHYGGDGDGAAGDEDQRITARAASLVKCMESARGIAGIAAPPLRRDVAAELAAAQGEIGRLEEQLREAALAVNHPRQQNEVLQERNDALLHEVRDHQQKFTRAQEELAAMTEQMEDMVARSERDLLKSRVVELETCNTDMTALIEAVHAAQRHPMLPQALKTSLAEALKGYNVAQGCQLTTAHGASAAMLAAKTAQCAARMRRNEKVPEVELAQLEQELRLDGSASAAQMVAEALRRVGVGNLAGAVAALQASAAISAASAAQGIPKGPRIGALLAKFEELCATLKDGGRIAERHLTAVLDEACHLAGLGRSPAEVASMRIAKRCREVGAGMGGSGAPPPTSLLNEAAADDPAAMLPGGRLPRVHPLIEEVSVAAKRHPQVAPQLLKVASLLASATAGDAAVEASAAADCVRAVRLASIHVHHVARKVGANAPTVETVLAARQHAAAKLHAARDMARGDGLRLSLDQASTVVARSVDHLLRGNASLAAKGMAEAADKTSQAAGCGSTGCCEAARRLANACADLSGKVAAAVQSKSLGHVAAVLAEEAAALSDMAPPGSVLCEGLQRGTDALRTAVRCIENGRVGRGTAEHVSAAGAAAWAAAEGHAGVSTAANDMQAAVNAMSARDLPGAVRALQDAARALPPTNALLASTGLDEDRQQLQQLHRSLEDVLSRHGGRVVGQPADVAVPLDVLAGASEVSKHFSELAGAPSGDEAAALIIAEQVLQIIAAASDEPQRSVTQLAIDAEKGLHAARASTGAGPSAGEAGALALSERLSALEEVPLSEPLDELRAGVDAALEAASLLARESGVVGTYHQEVAAILGAGLRVATAADATPEADRRAALMEAVLAARVVCEGTAAACGDLRQVANALYAVESRAAVKEPLAASDFGELAGRTYAAIAKCNRAPQQDAKGHMLEAVADALGSAAARVHGGEEIRAGEVARMRDDVARAAGLPVKDPRLTAEELAGLIDGVAHRITIGEPPVTPDDLEQLSTAVKDAAARHSETRVGLLSIEEDLHALASRAAQGVQPLASELTTIALAVRQVVDPVSALRTLSSRIAGLPPAPTVETTHSIVQACRVLGQQYPELEGILSVLAEKLEKEASSMLASMGLGSAGQDLVSSVKTIIRHPNLEDAARRALLDAVRDAEAAAKVLSDCLAPVLPGGTVGLTNADLREAAHEIVGENANAGWGEPAKRRESMTYETRQHLAEALKDAERDYFALLGVVSAQLMEDVPQEARDALHDALRRDSLFESVRAVLCHPSLPQAVRTVLKEALKNSTTAPELTCCIRDALTYRTLPTEARNTLESALRGFQGDDLSTIAAAAALRGRELVKHMTAADVKAVRPELVTLSSQLRAYGAMETAGFVSSAASALLSEDLAAALRAMESAVVSATDLARSRHTGESTAQLFTSLASLQRRLTLGHVVGAEEVRYLRNQACSAAGLGPGVLETSAHELLSIIAKGDVPAAVVEIQLYTERFPDMVAPMELVLTELRRKDVSAATRAEAMLRRILEALEEVRIVASSVGELAWRLGLGHVEGGIDPIVTSIRENISKIADVLPGPVYERLHHTAEGVGNAVRLAAAGDTQAAIAEAKRCVHHAELAGGCGMDCTIGAMKALSAACTALCEEAMAVESAVTPSTLGGTSVYEKAVKLEGHIQGVVQVLPAGAVGEGGVERAAAHVLRGVKEFADDRLSRGCQEVFAAADLIHTASEEHRLLSDAAAVAARAASSLAAGEVDSGLTALARVLEQTKAARALADNVALDAVIHDLEALHLRTATLRAVGGSREVAEKFHDDASEMASPRAGGAHGTPLHTPLNSVRFLSAAEAATVAEVLRKLAGETQGEQRHAAARLMIEHLTSLLTALKQGTQSPSQLAVTVDHALQTARSAVASTSPSKGETGAVALAGKLENLMAALEKRGGGGSQPLHEVHAQCARAAVSLASGPGVVGAAMVAIVKSLREVDCDRVGLALVKGPLGHPEDEEEVEEARHKVAGIKESCDAAVSATTDARLAARLLEGIEARVMGGDNVPAEELGEVAGRLLSAAKKAPKGCGSGLSDVGDALSVFAARAADGKRVLAAEIGRLRDDALRAAGLPVADACSAAEDLAVLLDNLSARLVADAASSVQASSSIIAPAELSSIATAILNAAIRYPSAKTNLTRLADRVHALAQRSSNVTPHELANVAYDLRNGTNPMFALESLSTTFDKIRRTREAGALPAADMLYEARELLQTLSAQHPKLRGVLCAAEIECEDVALTNITGPSGAGVGADGASTLRRGTGGLVKAVKTALSHDGIAPADVATLQQAMASSGRRDAAFPALNEAVAAAATPLCVKQAVTEVLAALEAGGDADEVLRAMGRVPEALFTDAQQAEMRSVLCSAEGLKASIERLLAQRTLPASAHGALYDAWAWVELSGAVRDALRAQGITPEAKAVVELALGSAAGRGAELACLLLHSLAEDPLKTLPATVTQPLAAAVARVDGYANAGAASTAQTGTDAVRACRLAGLVANILAAGGVQPQGGALAAADLLRGVQSACAQAASPSVGAGAGDIHVDVAQRTRTASLLQGFGDTAAAAEAVWALAADVSTAPPAAAALCSALAGLERRAVECVAHAATEDVVNSPRSRPVVDLTPLVGAVDTTMDEALVVAGARASACEAALNAFGAQCRGTLRRLQVEKDRQKGLGGEDEPSGPLWRHGAVVITVEDDLRYIAALSRILDAACPEVGAVLRDVEVAAAPGRPMIVDDFGKANIPPSIAVDMQRAVGAVDAQGGALRGLRRAVVLASALVHRVEGGDLTEDAASAAGVVMDVLRDASEHAPQAARDTVFHLLRGMQELAAALAKAADHTLTSAATLAADVRSARTPGRAAAGSYTAAMTPTSPILNQMPAAGTPVGAVSATLTPTTSAHRRSELSPERGDAYEEPQSATSAHVRYAGAGSFSPAMASPRTPGAVPVTRESLRVLLHDEAAAVAREEWAAHHAAVCELTAQVKPHIKTINEAVTASGGVERMVRGVADLCTELRALLVSAGIDSIHPRLAGFVVAHVVACAAALPQWSAAGDGLRASIAAAVDAQQKLAKSANGLAAAALARAATAAKAAMEAHIAALRAAKAVRLALSQALQPANDTRVDGPPEFTAAPAALDDAAEACEFGLEFAAEGSPAATTFRQCGQDLRAAARGVDAMPLPVVLQQVLQRLRCLSAVDDADIVDAFPTLALADVECPGLHAVPIVGDQAASAPAAATKSLLLRPVGAARAMSMHSAAARVVDALVRVGHAVSTPPPPAETVPVASMSPLGYHSPRRQTAIPTLMAPVQPVANTSAASVVSAVRKARMDVQGCAGGVNNHSRPDPLPKGLAGTAQDVALRLRALDAHFDEAAGAEATTAASADALAALALDELEECARLAAGATDTPGVVGRAMEDVLTHLQEAKGALAQTGLLSLSALDRFRAIVGDAKGESEGAAVAVRALRGVYDVLATLEYLTVAGSGHVRAGQLRPLHEAVASASCLVHRGEDVLLRNLAADFARVVRGDGDASAPVPAAVLTRLRGDVAMAAGGVPCDAAWAAHEVATALDRLASVRVAMDDPSTPAAAAQISHELEGLVSLARYNADVFPNERAFFEQAAELLQDMRAGAPTTAALRALAKRLAHPDALQLQLLHLSQTLERILPDPNPDDLLDDPRVRGLAGTCRALAAANPGVKHLLETLGTYIESRLDPTLGALGDAKADLVESIRLILLHPQLGNAHRERLRSCMNDVDKAVQEVTNGLADMLREKNMATGTRAKVLAALTLAENSAPATSVRNAMLQIPGHELSGPARQFLDEAPAELANKLDHARRVARDVANDVNMPDEARRALWEAVACDLTCPLTRELIMNAGTFGIKHGSGQMLRHGLKAGDAGRAGELGCILRYIAGLDGTTDEVRHMILRTLHDGESGFYPLMQGADARTAAAQDQARGLQAELDAILEQKDAAEAELTAVREEFASTEAALHQQLEDAEANAKTLEGTTKELEDACRVLERQLQRGEADLQKKAAEIAHVNKELAVAKARGVSTAELADTLSTIVDWLQTKPMVQEIRDNLLPMLVSAQIEEAEAAARHVLAVQKIKQDTGALGGRSSPASIAAAESTAALSRLLLQNNPPGSIAEKQARLDAIMDALLTCGYGDLKTKKLDPRDPRYALDIDVLCRPRRDAGAVSFDPLESTVAYILQHVPVSDGLHAALADALAAHRKGKGGGATDAAKEAAARALAYPELSEILNARVAAEEVAGLDLPANRGVRVAQVAQRIDETAEHVDASSGVAWTDAERAARALGHDLREGGDAALARRVDDAMAGYGDAGASRGKRAAALRRIAEDLAEAATAGLTSSPALAQVLTELQELEHMLARQDSLDPRAVSHLLDAALAAGGYGKGAAEVAAECALDACRRAEATPNACRELADSVMNVSRRHPEVADALARCATALRQGVLDVAASHAHGIAAHMREVRIVAADVADLARQCAAGDLSDEFARRLLAAGTTIEQLINTIDSNSMKNKLTGGLVGVQTAHNLLTTASPSVAAALDELQKAEAAVEEAAGCGVAAVSETARRVATACVGVCGLLASGGGGHGSSSPRLGMHSGSVKATVQQLAHEATAAARAAPGASVLALELRQCGDALRDALALEGATLDTAVRAAGNAATSAAEAQMGAARAAATLQEARGVAQSGAWDALAKLLARAADALASSADAASAGAAKAALQAHADDLRRIIPEVEAAAGPAAAGTPRGRGFGRAAMSMSPPRRTQQQHLARPQPVLRVEIDVLAAEVSALAGVRSSEHQAARLAGCRANVIRVALFPSAFPAMPPMLAADASASGDAAGSRGPSIATTHIETLPGVPGEAITYRNLSPPRSHRGAVGVSTPSRAPSAMRTPGRSMSPEPGGYGAVGLPMSPGATTTTTQTATPQSTK